MQRRTLGIVITAHNQNVTGILDDLTRQDRAPDQVVLLYSGVCSLDVGQLQGERHFKIAGRDAEIHVSAYEHPDRDDWGHEKRDLGWRHLTTDYVAWWNADDTYSEDYIESMMAEVEADLHDETVPVPGFVYTYWNRFAPCEPRSNSSTSGNFIVARHILELNKGWTGRHYEADGEFIDAAVNWTKVIGMSVIGIPRILYHWNTR